MGRYIFLLVFAFLNSSTVFSQKNFLFKGHSYLFELSMEKSGNKKFPDCKISNIKIISRQKKEHIQSIVPPKNLPQCNIGKKELFVISDINFDGHEDIRMKVSNNAYIFWVFNPDVEEFIRYKELELLSDPYLDFDNKEVISNWTYGCCRSGSSHYKYINNKLTLIKEKEVLQSNNDSTKFVVKQLINGNMKIVEEGYQ